MRYAGGHRHPELNISLDIPFMKQDGQEHIGDNISDIYSELLNRISDWISKGSR